MEHTLEMIAAAERQGADVAFDVIPHDWNHTLIQAILPPWALEGGIPSIVERLKDPDIRERIESRCTMKKPREYATGIDHVLVNGRLAMRDGVRTQDGGGEVLRP